MKITKLSSVIFVLFSLLTHAQEIHTGNYAGIEIGGKGSFYANITMESFVCKNISIGAGMAFGYCKTTKAGKAILELTEENKANHLFLPIYSNVYLNKKQQFFITYGVNLIGLSFDSDEYEEFLYRFYNLCFIGIGYELPVNNKLIRLQTYLHIIENDNKTFPDGQFWAGLSIYLPLNKKK